MESKKICSCFVLVILAVVNGRPCPALPQLEHAVHNFCEIPRAPDNGRFEFPPNTRKFQAGSRIVLRCVDGFVPNGGNTQTCLSDGTWDGISPKCIDRANSAENIPINKSRRRKRGENTDQAKLAKLPFGNDLFNGEESKLEDLTNSHVGTERADNANTKSRPPIPSNERVDNPSNITNLNAGTGVGTNVTNGFNDGECLPTGRRNGQPPGCEEKKETGFGLLVIIIFVVLSIGVLYMKKNYARIKRQNTTPNCLKGTKMKPFENGRIDELELRIRLLEAEDKFEPGPDLIRLFDSEPVNIREDGNNVQSLRQKVEISPVMALPPQSAFGSSTGTRERPVTSTDDEHAPTESPAKVSIIDGSKDIVKNQGEASASSDGETDSSSSRHDTVNDVIETSMDADKRPESRLMDDIASDDGRTDDDYGSTNRNNLIAQETGRA